MTRRIRRGKRKMGIRHGPKTVRLARDVFAKAGFPSSHFDEMDEAAMKPFLAIADAMIENPQEWKTLLPLPAEDPSALVMAHVAMVREEAGRPEDERDRGTPEGRAKRVRALRADVLKRLVDNKLLNNRQIAAALEIRNVYAEISRKMEAPAVDPGKQPVDTSMGDYVLPLELSSEGIRRAYRERYLPWAREATATRVARHSGFTHFDVAIRVLLHNTGPRQLEQGMRVRRGMTVTKALRAALTLYADIAGWGADHKPAGAEFQKSAA